MKNLTIGFIGLGNMGMGMASNLLKYCLEYRHKLLVFDTNDKAIENLVVLGAINGQSIGNIASQCDIIFTSLPSAKEVNTVALAENGILKNAKTSLTWFETSTNELSEWQKIIDADAGNITFIDAPVTGGAEGAAAGTLTMLLGIDDEILKMHSPLLSSFTSKAIKMGPSGAGYVGKLCQLHLNYLVAQGIGEALMLGSKAHLDLNTLWEVMKNSCARSYVVESYIPKILDGSYDDSFTLGLATKDMRLISQLGKQFGTELTLGDTVYESYQKASKKYGDDAPHLSINKIIEEQSQQLLR